MRTSPLALALLWLLAAAARAEDGPDCTPIETGEICAEGKTREFVVVPGGCAQPDDRDWEKVGIANYYLWTDRACTAAPAAQQNCEGFSPRPAWCDAAKPAANPAPPMGSAGSLPSGPPPNVAGCPKPGNIAFGGMNFKHTHTFLDVAKGVTDSFLLPKTHPNSGAPLNGGMIAGTGAPWSPDMTLEWSISRCPGDFDYYKTAAAAVDRVRSGRPAGTARDGTPTAALPAQTVTHHPCGGISGIESSGVKWVVDDKAIPPGSVSGYCKITAGESWYANVRVLRGCPDKCQFVAANAWSEKKP